MSLKPRIPIGIDLETYYDTEYSLRRLSTVEYVRDPRFELHLASIIMPDMWGDTEPRTLVGAEQFQKFCDHLNSLTDEFDFVLIGNNSAFFDALVIKEHFGFYFRHHADQMTNAGWCFGNRLKNRKLETIVQHMGLQPDARRRDEAFAALGLVDDGQSRKISAALGAVKGLRLKEIEAKPSLMRAYVLYCEQDVLYSWQIHTILSPLMTQDTADIADFYYRAYLDMPLAIDTPMLATLKDDYQEDRANAIEAFGASLPDGVEWEGIKTLRSKDKFAALLIALGVSPRDVPMKVGKPDKEGNARMIYAFDKQSMALDDLAAQYDDGESLIPTACELRLEYNSSATESKLLRFSAVGETGGWAMAIRPYGASNTARHSGTSSTGASPQNMKRAKPCFYPASCNIPVRFSEAASVRDAIGVPEGFELVVCDLSGIELRCNLTIANDQKYMQILRDPTQDVYCTTASVLFDKPVTKKDKDERFVGKLAELSLGYLTGWRKLHLTARLWGSPISTHVAQLAHASYRQAHPSVVDTWAYYEDLLERWTYGSVVNEQFGVFWMEQKGVRTQSGFLIQFPDLQAGWRKLGRGNVRSYTHWNASKMCRVNVHPGLVHENLCQASAAQVFNDMHIRIQNRCESVDGLFAGSVHDEFLYRVPVGNGAAMLRIMQEEMEIPPVWWPELPVTSEGDHGFGVMEHADKFSIVSRYGMLK